MRVGILGPVVIEERTTVRQPDAPKVRALLTALAANLDRPVPVSALIGALWGEDPPLTAEKTLQGHVSALRRLIGADIVVTSASGYTLVLPPEAVDLTQFESLVRAAADLGEDDRARARDLYAEALGLWRGDPLVDLADGPFRQGLAVRLEELKGAAEQGRLEADLALGRHADVLPELRQAVSAAPLREDLRADLILALYRADRQADALKEYRDLRDRLREELGLDPSPRLQDLERDILLQSPELDLAAPPTTNLAAAVSSFVGREHQIAEVREMLAEHRLVTLLGPGGVGKSRLALEVARSQLDSWEGVWWVDLGGATDPGSVLGRIAAVLGVTPGPGVPLDVAVGSHVRKRSLLVVMDDCEQVPDVAGRAAERLLRASAGSAVLATSRIPLGVDGEHRFVVPPLSVPDDPTGELLQVESVRLFTARVATQGVRLTSPDDLRAAAELCRELDGFPLAIELAATRTSILSPRDLARELCDPARALSVDAPEMGSHHRSMAIVFDHSYELLEPDDRLCFARLGVFPGDFDLTAAAAVIRPEGGPGPAAAALARLIDSSLVVATTVDGHRRFRLLDLLRDYALLRLGIGADRRETERRHAEHFRDVAVDAGRVIEGPAATRWLDLIRREDHNLRAAVEWLLEHERPTDALRFASAIGHAWYVWGELDGARSILERLLAQGRDAPPELRAMAHLRLGWPRFLGGDLEGGVKEACAAACDFEAAHDPIGVGRSLQMQAHMTLLGRGAIDEALPLYRTALDLLSDQPGAERDRAWVQITMAQALLLADRYDQSIDALLDEAEQALVEASDTLGLAHLAMDRVFAAYTVDDVLELEQAATLELGRSRSIGDVVYEQIALIALGLAAAGYRSDLSRAAPLLSRAVTLAWDTGNLLQLGIALQATAAVVTIAGDPLAGASLWGSAMTLSPSWPLFARRYGELMAPARAELGDAFAVGESAGAALRPEEAVELALTTLGAMSASGQRTA